MVNDVVLVGRIKELAKEVENKRDLVLEVERPFNDVEGRVSDCLVCRLWTSVFNKILKYCKKGDMIAIRGRIVNESCECIIMAENVVILNKSRDNILKHQQI